MTRGDSAISTPGNYFFWVLPVIELLISETWNLTP
jgi:hypothetical protein